ncbi:MAG: ABC transporter permease [Thermomicrobiales bacterium]
MASTLDTRSLPPVPTPPTSLFVREGRGVHAFVARNIHLVRRYWGWEIAFFVFTVANSLSIMYIGKAQQTVNSPEATQRLILYLGIGTLVWSYLRAVFDSISEMIAWERWEGTIEYTMMAPVSRLTHLLGTALFSIVYGVVRTGILLVILSSFFRVDLSHVDATAAAIVLLIGSLSFVGVGMVAAVLPLLFPERGAEMTFVISGILLLVSGVYYPVSVLPGWMQPLATVSPATYVLRGMRSAILDGQGVTHLGGTILPLLLIGLVSIPIGMWVFGIVERYAKRTGKLKRSG